MFDNNLNTIKGLSKIDEIELFLNKSAVVNTSWFNRPIYGIITEIGQSFVSLRKKDGRILKIRRSSILAIEEAREEI